MSRIETLANPFCVKRALATSRICCSELSACDVLINSVLVRVENLLFNARYIRQFSWDVGTGRVFLEWVVQFSVSSGS